MATEVKLPRLGQGMESGIVGKWLKSEGDPVEKGEPLYEVETDKATQEVESDVAGVLLKIVVSEGEVPVGQTIAVIGEAGEDLPSLVTEEPPQAGTQPAEEPDAAVEEPAAAVEEPAAAVEEPAAAVEEPAAAVEEPAEAVDDDGARHGDESVANDAQAQREPASAPVSAPVGDGARHGDESAPEGGRIKASPLARRMARERGLELSALAGTGPDGRIIAEDVERGAAAPAPETPAPETPAPAAKETAPAFPAGEVESIPLTTIRKTIARRLTAAWEIPVFVLTVSVDMTPANGLIERSRELNPDVRITVTDLLAKVCAQALMRHPEVNVQFTDEAILRLPTANIGIAVAAPQGLVVPVVHSVERHSLVEIAVRRAEVIGRARENKLKQDDLEGGTFTISNLGMYGVEQFVAILNPPQAAILAVGATDDRAVVSDSQVVVRPMMTISLTVDHRAVDGAPAAEFLQTVKTFLEEPALAL